MKSVLLVRVSTLSQDYRAQKEDLIEYSKQLGIEEYHIIEDKESAIKLTEEERNGLNDMKEWFKTHSDYNSVIVWEISRLARSEKVLHSIKDYFLDNHIQLYIYDKRYKLLNEDGTENQETGLLFSLYAYFAENEMKVKKDRFRRSKKLNSEQGKYNGSKIKFGYKIDENKYIVPDEADAQTVKEIFEMYATGRYSIPEVTKEFNSRGVDLSNHYITEMLSFTGYIGYTDYNDSRRSHRKFIPIVDKSLYDKVQEVKKSNSTSLSKSKRYYFGNKILKCPNCGSNFIYKGTVYTCIKSALYKECDNHVSISSEWCDILLWYIALTNHKKLMGSNKNIKIAALRKEKNILSKKIANLHKQVDLIKKKFERANMLFVDMKINEVKYKEIEAKLNNDYKTIEDSINKYNNEITQMNLDIIQILNSGKFEFNPDGLSLKDMKKIVETYIIRVYVFDEIRNKKHCKRLQIFYKQILEENIIPIACENYYFYSHNKQKFEFNGEIIDDKIKDLCGDTLLKIRPNRK